MSTRTAAATTQQPIKMATTRPQSCRKSSTSRIPSYTLFLAVLSLLLLTLVVQQHPVDAQGHARTTASTHQHRLRQQQNGNIPQQREPEQPSSHERRRRRRHLTKEERRQEYFSRSLNELKTRVFGGWDTVEDRFSYAQVSLETIADGHQCGGSLIAVDVILTGKNNTSIYARSGMRCQ